jgi:hypothetical protein
MARYFWLEAPATKRMGRWSTAQQQQLAEVLLDILRKVGGWNLLRICWDAEHRKVGDWNLLRTCWDAEHRKVGVWNLLRTCWDAEHRKVGVWKLLGTCWDAEVSKVGVWIACRVRVKQKADKDSILGESEAKKVSSAPHEMRRPVLQSDER